MGYCYQGNQLCCDICGTAGARKFKCPFGWCQPLAGCPRCRKERAAEFQAAAHRERGCEAASKRFHAEEQARAAAADAGEFVLCAGLMHENGMVHAIFRGKDGERGKFVPRDLYDSRTPCQTITDFEARGGQLADAPTNYY